MNTFLPFSSFFIDDDISQREIQQHTYIGFFRNLSYFFSLFIRKYTKISNQLNIIVFILICNRYY